MITLTIDQALTLARQHAQAGRMAEAGSIAQKILEIQPGNLEAGFILSSAAVDLPQTVELLARVVALHPENADAHYSLAGVLRRQGQLERSAFHFHEATKQRSSFIQAHIGLVAVLEQMGRFDQALVACRNAGRAYAVEKVKAMLSGHLIRRPEPVLFDVGANVGYVTEGLRSQFPRAVIHAFEPHPRTFLMLQERAERLGGITVNQAAVGDTDGTLTLRLNSDHGTSSALDIDPNSPYVRGTQLETVETVDVPVVTLDHYCHERGLEQIDFLKLDVQGFEANCLRGARKLLSRKAIGCIQLEIIFPKYYRKTGSFYEIEDILVPLGYRLFTIFDIYPEQGEPLFQVDAIYVPA